MTVIVQENNALPSTMAEPVSRWLEKLLKGSSSGGSLLPQSTPWGALLPLDQRQLPLLTLPPLPETVFSFSVRHQNIAHPPSRPVQWPRLLQSSHKFPLSSTQGCLLLAHSNSLWPQGNLEADLTWLPTSWVAWVSSVASLGLYFLIYELGLKYLPHRVTVRGK